MYTVSGGKGARCRVLRMCLLLLPACAGASELLPTAGVGVIYSDNIVRQEPAKADEAAGALVGLRYLNSTAHWNADIEARGTHVEFLQHTYSSETLGWGIANLALSIVPSRLSWELQDNYGQAAVDPFGAIVALDRQNINYLTTGPDITLPFGAADRLDVEGRYSNVDYADTSTLNNKRFSVTGAFVHPLTSIRTLSINLYDQRTDFAHTELFRNYDLRSAYLTLISSPRRSRYELDVGATEVDDGLTVHRGTLLSAIITHNLNDYHSLQLYARRGFADSADTFRFEQGGGSSNPFLIGTNVQVRADPYTETRVDASWTMLMPRDSLALTGYWLKEDYVNSSLFNRRLFGASAAFMYVWSPEVRLDALVTYDRDTFAAGQQDDRDFGVSLAATRRLAEALNLTLRIERYNRQSPTNPFTENRATISLVYAPQSRGLTSAAQAAGSYLDRARGTNSRPTIQPQPATRSQ